MGDLDSPAGVPDPTALAEAIHTLPEAEKVVMTLVYYEGLTDAEVAANLTESEATVSALHESALQQIAAAVGLPSVPSGQMIHPVYLPFTDQALAAHFAPIKGKPAKEAATDHLRYYRTSAERYAEFCEINPLPTSLPINAMRSARQIEKDERFWVVAALMTYYRVPDRSTALATLLTRAFSANPPVDGFDRWEDCFTDDTVLFFEANLPAPASYKDWLKENLPKQHLVPYVLEAAAVAGGLEGAT